MSCIKRLDPEDEPLWDRFVESHPHGWVCHLSAWKKVLEESFPHIRCRNHLVKWNEDKTRIIAGLPLYDVKSYLLGNRLVGIPYATLCDPLFENHDDLAELLDEATEIYRIGRYKNIEIRSHQTSFCSNMRGFNLLKNYKNHFLCLDGSLDKIEKSIDRDVRRLVRKANKAGFHMRYAHSEKEVRIFYNIYTQTRKTLGLPPHPYRFFLTFWNILSSLDLTKLILLYKDGQPVAGVILFTFKNRVSAEYGAWDRNFAKDCPNHFLYWSSIKYAYDQNFKIFDFGRTLSDNNSLMSFKKKWGTQLIDLPQCYYQETGAIKTNKMRSKKLMMLHRIIESSPQKVCQWIGDYCYRHLG